MNAEIITKFKKYYSDPMLQEVSFIDEFCDPDFKYQDPMREIQGLENFKNFHEKFRGNLHMIRMKYTHQSILHDKAFLSWECELEFRVLRKKICFSGITVLIVTDKVIWQRNYYDDRTFMYESWPVIGSLLKWVKVLVSHK